MPQAHGPFGKDSLTRSEFRHLEGVPFLNNVQTPNAISEAHGLGARCISYISFYDTYVHIEGFENGTARIPWDSKNPQVLLLDAEGRFCNTPMDNTWRMWRYLVCSNTKQTTDAALALARQQMERGADGLFVDNSTSRAPCYGHGFPMGFSPKYRQVLTGQPSWPGAVGDQTPEALHRKGLSPEFWEHDNVQSLPRHRHLYPDLSHDDAYARLLGKVRRLVKSYGSDKVLTINGRVGAQHADAVMLESFVYSWGWEGARNSWKELQAQAKDLRKELVAGTRVIALSYVGRTTRTVEEDALFACCAALNLGYIWAGGSGVKGKLGQTLRRLDLGGPGTSIDHDADVSWTWFEKGLAVVNGGRRKRTVSVPADGTSSPLRKESDRTRVLAKDNAYRIQLPAQGGRLLFRL